jgi:catechol 2,3-dioxygenase-like lactoylglutathione lyase family enzyme
MDRSWDALLPVRSVNHITRVVKDLDKSADFYREVLGFMEVRRPTGIACDGVWLYNYGLGLHLLRGNPQPRSSEIRPKDDHISFEADSNAVVETHLQRLGISYVKDAVKHAHYIISQIFFHDPDGHMLEVCDCNVLPVVPLDPRATLEGGLVRLSLDSASNYLLEVEVVQKPRIDPMISCPMDPFQDPMFAALMFHTHADDDDELDHQHNHDHQPTPPLLISPISTSDDSPQKTPSTLDPTEISSAPPVWGAPTLDGDVIPTHASLPLVPHTEIPPLSDPISLLTVPLVPLPSKPPASDPVLLLTVLLAPHPTTPPPSSPLSTEVVTTPIMLDIPIYHASLPATHPPSDPISLLTAPLVPHLETPSPSLSLCTEVVTVLMMHDRPSDHAPPPAPPPFDLLDALFPSPDPTAAAAFYSAAAAAAAAGVCPAPPPLNLLASFFPSLDPAAATAYPAAAGAAYPAAAAAAMSSLFPPTDSAAAAAAADISEMSAELFAMLPSCQCTLTATGSGAEHSHQLTMPLSPHHHYHRPQALRS